jgi:hypothetical protein
MSLINMAKDNKKRLFEVFERVTGAKIKEWYDDEYYEKPKYPHGIGDFNNIDWQVLHEQLVLNTNVLKAGSKSTEKHLAATVNDLTDYDGMLSPEELQHLDDFGLININGTFPNIGGVYPIIEDEKYFDFNTFKVKAAEIWNKEVAVQQTGDDSEAPHLRGNESMSESDINAVDWDDKYTNENLVIFLKKWFGALRFYDDNRKSAIIAKALEDEFPTLKNG